MMQKVFNLAELPLSCWLGLEEYLTTGDMVRLIQVSEKMKPILARLSKQRTFDERQENLRRCRSAVGAFHEEMEKRLCIELEKAEDTASNIEESSSIDVHPIAPLMNLHRHADAQDIKKWEIPTMDMVLKRRCDPTGLRGSFSSESKVSKSTRAYRKFSSESATDFDFPVLLLGSSRVGKTCMLKRYLVPLSTLI
jgi:hypothetical protein